MQYCHIRSAPLFCPQSHACGRRAACWADLDELGITATICPRRSRMAAPNVSHFLLEKESLTSGYPRRGPAIVTGVVFAVSGRRTRCEPETEERQPTPSVASTLSLPGTSDHRYPGRMSIKCGDKIQICKIYKYFGPFGGGYFN